MSIHLVNAAFDAPLSCRHKLVLMAICNFANHQGECYPSYTMIAKKASTSVSTVKRVIGTLEKFEYIRRETNTGCRTYYYVNDPSQWRVPERSNPAHFDAEKPPFRDAEPSSDNELGEVTGEPGEPSSDNDLTQLTDEPGEVKIDPAHFEQTQLISGGVPSSNDDPNPAHFDPSYITIIEPSIEPSLEPLDNGDPGEPAKPADPPKTAKPKPYSPIDDLISRGVDSETIADWLALRKKRKAPVTQRVLNRFADKATEAGLSMQEVLQICCDRGWTGFEPHWVKSATSTVRPAPRESERDRERREFIESVTGQRRARDVFDC